jgi:putative hydrolase of the HAD superfamily
VLPYDAVLFDAGNTLVFVDGVRVHTILGEYGARIERAEFEALEREARLVLSRRMGDEATGDDAQVWRDYFTTLIAQSGVPTDRMGDVGEAIRTSHEARHLWTFVRDGTHAAVAAVRDLGYRTAVVSNADGRVEALLQDRGLAEYLEFVIDSEVVGIKKPDRGIFDLAVERLGVPAKRVLYVGDLYAVDVLGARTAGLDALLLDPFDAFAHLEDVPRIPHVLELPNWLARLEGSAASE